MSSIIVLAKVHVHVAGDRINRMVAAQESACENAGQFADADDDDGGLHGFPRVLITLRLFKMKRIIKETGSIKVDSQIPFRGALQNRMGKSDWEET